MATDHKLLERAAAWANSALGRESLEAQREEVRRLLAERNATPAREPAPITEKGE